MEIFKDVIGYENLYQVSNLGNVKSLNYNHTGKQKELSKSVCDKGYYKVSLWLKGIMKTRSVHQLVAESFLNHKPNGYKLVINHINFNKLDNRVVNLEIVTARQNANQKHLQSTSKHVGVCWDKSRNKWKAQIKINGKNKFLGRFNQEIDANNAYQSKLLSLNHYLE